MGPGVSTKGRARGDDTDQVRDQGQTSGLVVGFTFVSNQLEVWNNYS